MNIENQFPLILTGIRNRISLAGIVLLFFAAGCKKAKDDPEIVGRWQLTKIETRATGGNWSKLNQACWLDDVEEYAPDGVWTLYDGINQCSPGNSVMKGTWKLTAGNSKVLFTYNGYSGEKEKTVESLSENSMLLVHNAGDLNNTQYRYTFSKR